MKSFLLRQGGRDVSTRQETVCEKFLIRHETEVFYRDRKLFAKGFLFGMGQKCFIAAGNYSRKVFYTA